MTLPADPYVFMWQNDAGYAAFLSVYAEDHQAALRCAQLVIFESARRARQRNTGT